LAFTVGHVSAVPEEVLLFKRISKGCVGKDTPTQGRPRGEMGIYQEQYNLLSVSK